MIVYILIHAITKEILGVFENPDTANEWNKAIDYSFVKEFPVNYS